MGSEDWLEFYRRADRETRLDHLEKLIEIVKFHEMRIGEVLEIIKLITRANQENRKTDCKQAALKRFP